MNILMEIRTRLDETNSLIARMERGLRDYPDDLGIAANLSSMVRMRAKLERRFNEAAAEAGIDVDPQRSFDGLSPPTIHGEPRQHQEEQPL